MSDTGTAPVTKDDIRMLMEEFGKMWQWKADIDKWKTEENQWKIDFEIKLDLWKQEIKNHFDLVAENIRYDFASTNREEIVVLQDGRKEHKQRILALEKVVGIAA